MAALILYHSIRNLGDYLSLSWSSFIKSIIFPRSCSNKVSKKKNNQSVAYSGQWHDIPIDIMEIIVIKRLTLADRIRMGSVCKRWRVVVLSEHIQRTCIEFPWLMLPQTQIGKQVSFYDFSNERVHNLKLPKSAHGAWCSGTTRGWLIIIITAGCNRFDPNFFLLNPISGAQLRLPSLTTIPLFGKNREEYLDWSWEAIVRTFITRIELCSSSSTDDTTTTECVVAATFFEEVLAFCRPNDYRWTIFQGRHGILRDILYREKTLYVLVSSVEKSVTTYTIQFSDCEVTLRLIPIPDVFPLYVDAVIDFQQFRILKKQSALFFLVEADDELLIITWISDLYIMNDDQLDEGDEHFTYSQTSGFEVFKINPNNDYCERLKSIGDRVLFLSHNNSLSFSSRNCKGIHENCIYFASSRIPGMRKHEPLVDRESGVFYLETGRIERSLPSIKCPEHAEMCWFTANL